MQFSLAVILAAATAMAAPTVEPPQTEAGTTHIVFVEFDRILPQNVAAKEGDHVWFRFGRGTNSIAEFEYGKPCIYKENGISSGVFETPEGKKHNSDAFVIDITSSDPIWYYNSYSNYCKAYLTVGSINSPENKDGSVSLMSIEALNAPKVDNPTELKGGTRKEKAE
ncbi:hypothetical protein CFIMG_008295RA00001 [Ceratocystis fimbriata CBS 114723]|uniref:Extracellular serine-rich protein n=1 Tax=Ceratocystis fimbriata CBS 114723 TaxID=1035309 RepID=A0A2C5X9W4_9PEZI|nr:hypothetical protein CFIMG_008295RA00001 [Ceratocystis fimbriata CBS 114723]